MDSEKLTSLEAPPDFPLMSTGPLWVFLVILLLVGAVWLWRRQRGLGPGMVSDLKIQILATRSLGPRAHLAIIEAAGHRSLIATTAQGVQHLRTLPKEAPAESASEFAQHLAGSEEGHSE